MVRLYRTHFKITPHPTMAKKSTNKTSSDSKKSADRKNKTANSSDDTEESGPKSKVSPLIPILSLASVFNIMTLG